MRYWQPRNANYRWMQLALDRYAKGPPSPKKGRGLALLNVAIYDAIALTTNLKQEFKRDRPKLNDASVAISDGYSYPSAHAAAATAAAGILSYLFPEDSSQFEVLAQQAGAARVDAGANYPSDVAVGASIGEQIADLVIDYANNDGSDRKWQGSRQEGPDKLKGDVFVHPGVGDWNTWVISSAIDYLPPAPAAIDSASMAEQMAELKSIERNVPLSIRTWTNHSTERAYQWWYESLASAVYEQGSSAALTDVALAYATAAAANHDAIVACFKAKYTYWFIRPAQLDSSLQSLFPSPPHPSYPSAHSCSTSSFEVAISHFFPTHESKLQAATEEAGYSRLIAGIHYRMDKTSGEALGRRVATKAVEFASSLKGSTK